MAGFVRGLRRERRVDAAAGEMGVVRDTVSKQTGHEPQTLADFLRRHLESTSLCSPSTAFRDLPVDLCRER
jgi:hypothetical protein